MVKVRFRPISSARDRPAVVVAVVVSIAFIFGVVHFYRVPLSTLSGYLLNLLVILVGLVLLALLITACFIIIRKCFSNR